VKDGFLILEMNDLRHVSLLIELEHGHGKLCLGEPILYKGLLIKRLERWGLMRDLALLDFLNLCRRYFKY
jgi:hypothetical protein